MRKLVLWLYKVRLELIERMMLHHMRDVSKGKYRNEHMIVELARDYGNIYNEREAFLERTNGG